MTELRPLREADLSRVEAVFTDVDGTLTTGRPAAAPDPRRRSSGSTGAGVRVVLVTGRPAGWAEAWARTLPVDGVIAENGGLYLRRDAAGAAAQGVRAAAAEREAQPQAAAARRCARRCEKVPGARLSIGQRATPRWISAIDYNEEARLGRRGGGPARGAAARARRDGGALLGARQLLDRPLRQARRRCGASCGSEWRDALAPDDRPLRLRRGLASTTRPMFAGLPAERGRGQRAGRAGPHRRRRRPSSPGRREGGASRSWPAPSSAARRRGDRSDDERRQAGAGPGLGRHLRAGHPWVFRKALEQRAEDPRRAAWWTSPRTGSSSPAATTIRTRPSPCACSRAIRGRPSTRPSSPGACEQAWPSAAALIDLTDTDSFRLVHGEGDGLPGVVVDLYAGYAVLKLYSAGLTPYRPPDRRGAEGGASRSSKGVIGRDEVGRDDAEEDDGRGAREDALRATRRRSCIAILERGAHVLRRRLPGPEDRLLPRPAREPLPHPPAGEGPRRAQLLLLHRRLLGERGAGRRQERLLGGPGRGRHRAGPRELHRATGCRPRSTTSSPRTSSSCSPRSRRRAGPSI